MVVITAAPFEKDDIFAEMKVTRGSTYEYF